MTCSCFYIMYFDCIDTPFPSLVPLPRIPRLLPNKPPSTVLVFCSCFCGGSGFNWVTYRSVAEGLFTGAGTLSQ